jgi:hypothetical protein
VNSKPREERVMTNKLRVMFVLLAVVAGVGTANSALAQSTAAKAMGKKWGDNCIPKGHSTTCCDSERKAEKVCQGEKGYLSAPVVMNCDDAKKICEKMVSEKKK